MIDQFHHPADPNILILSNRKKDSQPVGLAGQPGQAGHVDQGPASPQRQRRPQQLGPPTEAALLPGVTDQAFGDGDVGAVGAQVEQVSGSAGDDRRGVAEHPAQVRHVALHRVEGDVRVLAPHHLDEPVGADDLAGPQRENDQYRLAAQPGHRTDRAIRADYLDRSEQPYLHASPCRSSAASERLQS